LNALYYRIKIENMKKIPSKVAYFSLNEIFSVLPKTEQSAQAVENSHTVFSHIVFFLE
jgi:hypothetical protein